MKGSAGVSRLKVSADGCGVVSHAGLGLLREVAELTGLSSQVTAVLADTYGEPWTYAPGEVFADLAAAVADGADCVDGVTPDGQSVHSVAGDQARALIASMTASGSSTGSDAKHPTRPHRRRRADISGGRIPQSDRGPAHGRADGEGHADDHGGVRPTRT